MFKTKSWLAILLIVFTISLQAQETKLPPRQIKAGTEGQVLITDASGNVTQGEQAVQPYIAAKQYPIDALVKRDGELFVAISSNSVEPIQGQYWYKIPAFEPFSDGGSIQVGQKVQAGNKAIVAFVGDSKTQGRSRGPDQFRRRLIEDFGFAGYGYIPLDGGSFPGMNITSVGVTVHDSDVGFGDYSLSGFTLEMDAGDSYGYTNPTTTNDISRHDRVTLFYISEPGAGSFDITYGGTTQTVSTANGTIEKNFVNITGTYGNNEFLIDNISGTVKITDVIFNSDAVTEGVGLHIIGNGGYVAGAMTDNFAEPLNDAVIDSLKIDFAILRFGTNEWSGSVSPSDNAIGSKEIADTIKANFPLAGIMLTSVEDADITGVTYERTDYSSVQSGLASQEGYMFAPLSAIIPTWEQWEALGYADDAVHSNSTGGNVIGDFIYDVFIGKKQFSPQSNSNAVLSVEANAVPYGDASGSLVSDPTNLYFDQALDRLGLLTNTPAYTFDLPITGTTDWRLSGLSFDPTGGLLFDNTTANGLEGDVVFNINDGNKYEVNMDPTGTFEITGGGNVIMNYLNMSSTGAFTFDNTTVEGDVSFLIDAGNDFNIRLGGGGAANHNIYWNTNTLIGSWQFDRLAMSATLDMNQERIVDLPAPTADNDAARRIYVDDAVTAVEFGSGDSDADATEITNAADAIAATSLTTLQQVEALVPDIITASAALDYPSIGAGATADLTITATGAKVGDVVSLGAPNGAVGAGFMFFAWVSVDDVVTVRAFNSSGGAVDPISATFKVKVIL